MFCKIKSIDISTLSGISKLKGELLLWILYPTNQMKHWSINTIKYHKNYLMICLYNNLVNTNINKIIKKADTIKPNERDYPSGSLDFLYANFDMPTDTI